MKERSRQIVRTLCLVAAVFALLPATAGDWSTVAVPSLSPLVAAASLLATWTFLPTMLIGLCVAGAAVFRRRWFCSYVCPTGFCLAGASRLGMQIGRRCPKTPSLGPWIAWITLGAALLGYPALLWLDPLAMFSGAFGVFLPRAEAAAWIACSALPLVLLLSLLLPGMWCGRLCPLGALQESLFRLNVKAATALSDLPRNQHCLTRRRLLRVAAAGVIGAAWAASARAMRIAQPYPLRPPGARSDESFLGLCIRCGNCIRVCPSRIIEPDLGVCGIAGLMTPLVRFKEDYCREDCLRCMEVCPSGALSIMAFDKKRQAKIGLPRVDMDICLLGDDRECSICRNCCPYEAISLVFSESSYSVAPVIDLQKCPGCGACEAACPTRPAKAIQVLPLSEV